LRASTEHRYKIAKMDVARGAKRMRRSIRAMLRRERLTLFPPKKQILLKGWLAIP